MGTTTMPRKKRDGPDAPADRKDDRSGRKTAPIQVEKELAAMVAHIATHRGKTQAEIITPLIRPWVLANYAIVLEEGRERLKQARQDGEG